MKRCTKCGETKSLDEFYREKKSRDGLYCQCKACVRAYNQAYWRRGQDGELSPRQAAQQERARLFKQGLRTCDKCAKTKTLGEFHKDRSKADGLSYRCRTCVCEYDRRQGRQHRGRNLEKIRAYYREYYRNNPATWYAAVDRRRALELDAYVEDVDRQVVFDRDDGTCGICGEAVDALDWHLDHVIPLSRGGTHEYANVQVAHPVCNLVKGTRLSSPRMSADDQVPDKEES